MDFHNETSTCWLSLGFASQFQMTDALYIVYELGQEAEATLYLEHLDQGMSCENGVQSLKFKSSKLFFQFNREGVAALNFESEIVFRFQDEQLVNPTLMQVIQRICSYSPSR